MQNLLFMLEGESDGSGGGWLSIAMIVLLFVVLYFFMIRPQKKQEKKDAEMRDALAVGDEVTTIGGIIGKVISIKDETFVLESTKDKTKIRFLKNAIRSVDVKAADLAAAVMEAKREKEAAEAPAVEAPAEAQDAPAEAEDKTEKKD